MMSTNPLALSRPTKGSDTRPPRATKSRCNSQSKVKADRTYETLHDIQNTASIRPKSSQQQLVEDIRLVYSAIKSAYGNRSSSKGSNTGAKKQTTARKNRNLEICREQLDQQVKQSIRLQRESNILRQKCKELQNYVSKSGKAVNSSTQQRVGEKDTVSIDSSAAFQALKDENRLLKQHIQEATVGDRELELNSQLLNTENQALRKQLQISQRLSQEVFYHYQKLMQENYQNGANSAMRDEVEQLHRYIEELKMRNALEAATNALFRGIDPEKAKGLYQELILAQKESLYLRSDLKESNITIEALTNEIEKYKAECSGLKAYNQQLRGSIDYARAEVLQSSSIIMQQRQIMGKTKSQVATLQALVQQKDEQLAAAVTYLTQLARALEDMQRAPGVSDEFTASALLLCYKLDNIEYAVSLLSDECALEKQLRGMIGSRLAELEFHEEKAEMSFQSYERQNEQLSRWLEEAQQDLDEANERILALHNERDQQLAAGVSVQYGQEQMQFLKDQIARMLVERIYKEASEQKDSSGDL